MIFLTLAMITGRKSLGEAWDYFNVAFLKQPEKLVTVQVVLDDGLVIKMSQWRYCICTEYPTL